MRLISLSAFQSLHPISTKGRMKYIDYFKDNSLSVIEFFESKLQLNDFSDASNIVCLWRNVLLLF